jgi:hypothetical protein
MGGATSYQQNTIQILRLRMTSCPADLNKKIFIALQIRDS